VVLLLFQHLEQSHRSHNLLIFMKHHACFSACHLEQLWITVGVMPMVQAKVHRIKNKQFVVFCSSSNTQAHHIIAMTFSITCRIHSNVFPWAAFSLVCVISAAQVQYYRYAEYVWITTIQRRANNPPKHPWLQSQSECKHSLGRKHPHVAAPGCEQHTHLHVGIIAVSTVQCICSLPQSMRCLLPVTTILLHCFCQLIH